VTGSAPASKEDQSPDVASRRRHDDGRFDATELGLVGTTVLEALGASPVTAQTVADSLVQSNLVGHDSHGIVRLLQYSEWVRNGQIRPRAVPGVVKQRGATILVDGAWGFGQPAARLATDAVISAATSSGLAVACISSCNHIGRLGEYVALAAGAGLMGMAFCNAGPVVAPFGGSGRVMGTNPIAWAVPRAGDACIVLDFATANVAEGKLKIALADGQTVGPGSILDVDGRPTVQPADFYAGGALVPFGAHKGSGLSMLIEVTSGILSGMGASPGSNYQGGNGTLILALDVSAFLPLEQYVDEVESFCRDAKRIGGGASGQEILLPGEIEARTREDRIVNGVRVGPQIRRQITTLADDLGVDIGAFTTREAT
jgi:LDH2 family malate/lactate/ureidoglycolate dehydrogenase